MRRAPLIAFVAAAVFASGAAFVALATPPVGFGATPLGVTTTKRISINETEPSNVLFARVTLEPGGTTGWHSHPSYVFVLVKSGEAVRINHHCNRARFEEGEIFIERTDQIHRVINAGDEPAVYIATFVGLPPGSPTLIDEANPCLG
jgi:quercetin dioxygenase-like cupin family protein